MGFDGIASQAIMFIAVLGASAMLIVAFNNQVSSTSNAMTTQQDALEFQIKTDIHIETAIYNSTSSMLSFYARNTGTTALRIDKLSIYVNSQWITNTSRNLSLVQDTVTTNNGAIWNPNEVLAGNITIPLTETQVNTLRIITQYQTEDKYDFSIS